MAGKYTETVKKNIYDNITVSNEKKMHCTKA